MSHLGAISQNSRSAIYALIDAAFRSLFRQLPLSSATQKLALKWGYKYRPEPGLVKLRSGPLIQTTQVDHLQLLLYYFGTFEPECLAAMHRIVKPGDTVLDVGANVGLFTLEASLLVGAAGRVIAIEPMPEHASAVLNSARYNGMTNVEVISVAAGDRLGHAILTLPRNTNYGMFTLGDVAGDVSFTVPVRRIDDIVAEREVKSVDFIKMDIEGSELNALIGAEQTLRNFHPTILIELDEAHLAACKTSSREVKSFLKSLGYREFLLDGTLPVLGQAQPVNECLFVHKAEDDSATTSPAAIAASVS
jgi:FkbM family methyltransferase